MKNVIIFDHPYTTIASENEPHNRAYAAAVLKQTVSMLKAKGEDVDIIDLHADHFNPVMSAEDLASWRTGHSLDPQTLDYQNRLLDADKIIFIFPIWWELMPAMTKGFLDKVLSRSILPKHGKSPFPKNPTVIMMTTMGTPPLYYKLHYHKPVFYSFWVGTFHKIGLKKFKWLTFDGDAKLAKREAALRKIKF